MKIKKSICLVGILLGMNSCLLDEEVKKAPRRSEEGRYEIREIVSIRARNDFSLPPEKHYFDVEGNMEDVYVNTVLDGHIIYGAGPSITVSGKRFNIEIPGTTEFQTSIGIKDGTINTFAHFDELPPVAIYIEEVFGRDTPLNLNDDYMRIVIKDLVR